MKGKNDSYYVYRKLSKNPILVKDYRKITDLFIEFIINKLSNGEIVKLPEGLGEIVFSGKKIKPKVDDNGYIKGLTIDWKATKTLWQEDKEANAIKKIVYHFNEHTCGHRYRFIWYQKGSIVKNKYFYTFIPARSLKRRFAKYLINEQREFITNERIGNYKVSVKN